MKNIKLVVMDVDGTLTDGGVYIDSNGIENKRFDVQDGAGILIAQQVGIEFMIITGRKSFCVEKRAEELKIKYVYQGVHDKLQHLEEFMLNNHLEKEEVAYIGDDLNDYKSMKFVGVSACPNNAVEEIKKISCINLSKNGGNGAIREFIEILLKDRKEWEFAVEKFFGLNIEEEKCLC